MFRPSANKLTKVDRTLPLPGIDRPCRHRASVDRTPKPPVARMWEIQCRFYIYLPRVSWQNPPRVLWLQHWLSGTAKTHIITGSSNEVKNKILMLLETNHANSNLLISNWTNSRADIFVRRTDSGWQTANSVNALKWVDRRKWIELNWKSHGRRSQGNTWRAQLVEN